MKKIIVIFIAVLIYPGLEILAQTTFPKENSFKFDFGFYYETAGSYFNIQGKQIVQQSDPALPNSQDTSARKYSYDYREYIFDFGLSYGLSKDLSVIAEIPLLYNTLSEDYASSDTGLQTNRGTMSLFMPQYYKIGTKLRLDSGFITSFITTELKIPPKFKNGYQNDTANNFHKYSSYEFLVSANAILNFEKSWLEAGMMYNFRGGLFNDQLLVRLEGGFSTVPNTALRFMLLYCQDMGSYTNAVPFYQRNTTLQEDYIDFGVGFRANISKSFIADFSYLIRLGLKNTTAGGTFRLTGSWIF